MKTVLKYGVSLFALAVVHAGPAAAFEDVDWEWEATIDQNIDINIDINADNSFYPTGLTQVEQLQINVGNVSATSTQDDTVFQVEPVLASNGSFRGGPGHHQPDPVEPLDAPTQLGSLVGSAVAAGNYTSITSEVSTYAHDTQVAFGSFNVPDSGGDALRLLAAALATALTVEGDNQGVDAVSAASIAGIFGVIEPGQITATATATNVDNAQVDLSATAAGNMHSITVGTAEAPEVETVALSSRHGHPGNSSSAPSVVTDNIVIADINQFNLNNVSASADASGLLVSGYGNLAGVKNADGEFAPVSNVAAAAFGNYSSITNRVGGLPAIK